MQSTLQHKFLFYFRELIVILSVVIFFLAQTLQNIFYGFIDFTILLIISWVLALISSFLQFMFKERFYKKFFFFLLSLVWFAAISIFLYKVLIPPKLDYDDSLYAAIAIHEAGHAVIAEALTPGRVGDVVIIEPWRTRLFKLFNIDAKGFCKYASMLDENLTLNTAKDEICIKLSGTAAVNFFFPDLKSGGNQDDFLRAEEIVQKIINNGLSEAGPVTWNMLTDEQRSRIAQDIMQKEYERAYKLIGEHNNEVLTVSKLLRGKWHLNGKEVNVILNTSTP